MLLSYFVWKVYGIPQASGLNTDHVIEQQKRGHYNICNSLSIIFFLVKSLSINLHHIFLQGLSFNLPQTLVSLFIRTFS